MKEAESLPPGLPGCPGCAARDAKIRELEARIEALEQKLKLLEELLKRNSRNSHTPPSLDPRRHLEKKATGRKPGGQPGHEGQNRPLLAVSEVDEVIAHRPSICEACRAPLPVVTKEDDPASARHQVWELPERPCRVTEHQGVACICPACGHVTRGEIPAEIGSSCFGPRLAAVGSYLTGACGISRRQVEEVFEDVLGVPISVGTVSNLEKETTDALEEIHGEAGAHVREASVKNLDETGWKKKGKKCWLWASATARVAFFVIHPSRGKAGFAALVGKTLKGIFSSDRWHIYSARSRNMRQVCWSHLQRDFQKLLERGGDSKEIGKGAKELARSLFLAWKDFRTGDIGRETLKECLRPIQEEFERLMRKGARSSHRQTATFCQNILELGPALWTFTRVEGVEPTNNHAERVLRRAVIWRKRSFGADSDGGCRFVERVLTVVMTRRIQKRPVLAFLEAAIRAHRTGQQAPSLLPALPA